MLRVDSQQVVIEEMACCTGPLTYAVRHEEEHRLSVAPYRAVATDAKERCSNSTANSPGKARLLVLRNAPYK